MPPSVSGAHSRHAIETLVAALAALAVARLVFMFVPTMDAWALNLQRFLPTSIACGSWLLGALALLPAVARRTASWAERLGDATASGTAGAAMWALLTAALVLLLPDQTHLTGDFILRRRAIEEGGSPALLFPQALPLDAWIHWALPRWLFVRFGVPAAALARAWGALDAALLAVSAVAFTRALRFRGAPALAATGAIAFSGALALFTGYGKGLVDEAVAVAAVAALGARVVADGRGYLALGLATALAVALHRVGLLLLPAMLAAWGLGVRKHGVSRSALAGLALPLLAAALVGRQIVTIVIGLDLPVNIAHGVDVRRWTDVANALILTAPLAPLVSVLGAVYGRSLPRRPELVPAALLALLLIGLAFVIEPQQGPIRDWDLFAPAGMSLAVLAAWLAAEAVGEATPPPARRPSASRIGSTAGGVALAVVLAAAVPSVQWLIHLDDVTLGMRRVRAALSESPRRSELERARPWDYLGVRNAWLDDWSAAANAFAQSAALLPTPRVLDQWARAEISSGHWLRARDVCRSWTMRAPDDLNAWRTLAATVTRLNDRAAARDAAEHILRLDPNDPDARDILVYLDQTDSAAFRLPAAGATLTRP